MPDFLDAHIAWAAAQHKPTKRRAAGTVQTFPEHQIQSDFFHLAWLNRAAYPGLYDSLFAVPNGGIRPKKMDANGVMYSPEAIRLRKEGMKPGVPDAFLMLARCNYHGLAIEFKSATGRLSEMQQEWRDRLQANGYYWSLQREANVAWELAKNYYLERL